MASTAIIYRDNKVLRSTVLLADDAAKFVVLADGVRQAQDVMRRKPELAADGKSLAGSTSRDGVSYSELAPDDIYSILPRLAELLGKHPRAVYSHLDKAVNGEVLRNADGTPKHGLMLAHKNTPVPAPFHPAAALASQATTLGMLPTDGLAFDRTELLVDGPPPVQVGTEKRLDGLTYPVMAGGSAPTVRAYVKFRG